MIGSGQKYCNEENIRDLSTWEGSVWYYDGMRVYYQIADYTGDPSWNECAHFVRSVYRKYVLTNDGLIPGWRVFPQGLALDYLRTGDQESRRAAILLAHNSAFARNGGGRDFELSRETAYLIHAYLTAEELGDSRHVNLALAVDYALGHLDQWSVSQSASYVKPFMVGLTFEALIRYYESSGDPRILSAISQAADWLSDHAWDEKQRAFRYIVCRPGSTNQECREDHSSEGVDLNLLIAPAYAWLFRQTGQQKYLEVGDILFESGVEHAWLGSGKHFSQNYRWSFDFVRWRQ